MDDHPGRGEMPIRFGTSGGLLQKSKRTNEYICFRSLKLLAISHCCFRPFLLRDWLVMFSAQIVKQCKRYRKLHKNKYPSVKNQKGGESWEGWQIKKNAIPHAAVP